ncbi:MAG: hypothetical protein IJU73_06370, partial [Ruminococcus sp.]|nr:hypothetical protein [Ruminococcus sp.]
MEHTPSPLLVNSEDIGEVLKSITAIDIAPSKVESIIRRVVRNSLGGIGALAFAYNSLTLCLYNDIREHLMVFPYINGGDYLRL